MKDLSIIITNYNKAPMIDFLLHYFNRHWSDRIEVLCIDDCSTHMLDYPLSYGNIVHLRNTTNKGIGHVRQQGLDWATGRYVLFVDGDDIVQEDYLPTILTAIDEHPADVLEFWAINWPEGYIFKSEPMCWNKVYKREYLLEHKITFPNRRGSEDLIFNEKVYKHHPSVYQIEKIIYIYNTVTDGLTHKYNGYGSIAQ